MVTGQAQEQKQEPVQSPKQRSQLSLESVQGAVRKALDSQRLADELDDFVDGLLSEDSNEFITSFAQISGQ